MLANVTVISVIGIPLFLLATSLVRAKRWIVYLYAALYAATAWEYPNFGHLGTVGGTNLYLADVLSICLLAAAGYDWKRVVDNLGLRSALLSLGLLVTLTSSLIVGIASFGMKNAVNEFRPFVYLLAIFAWVISKRWRVSDLRTATVTFVVTQGIVLSGVELFHFLKYGLGSSSQMTALTDGSLQTTRPLVSGQALSVAVAACLAVWLWQTTGKRGWSLLAAVLVILDALTQQRTVWAALVGAGIYLAVTGPRRLRAGLIAVGASGLIVLAVFATKTSLGTQILHVFVSSASNSGTYDARVVGWQGLITQSFTSGAWTVLFGAPFGHGFVRYEGEGLVDFAPHNWYVTVYLRAGLVGLVLMLVLLAGLMTRIARARNALAGCILVIFLTYGWTYTWPWCAALPLILLWAPNSIEECNPYQVTRPSSRGTVLS